MAEGGGFEPPVRLLVHTLSKRARSTTPPPLRAARSVPKKIFASKNVCGTLSSMKNVWIVFGVALLLAGCGVTVSTESSPAEEVETPVAVAEEVEEKEASVVAEVAEPEEEKPVITKIIKMPNGLEYEILKEGKTPAAAPGDNLVMHYTGYLTDGTKFDSSVDRGQPFPFTLGGGQVIKGWDEGIVGMKIGETRKLTIPAEMGYGEMAIGSIPANSTLVFEVELLENRGTAIR